MSAKNFQNKFDKLKVKYKVDKKKMIIPLIVTTILLSLTVGTSYAYLKYISKTGHTTKIEAGTLAIEFKNEKNEIILDKAVPEKDEDGLNGDKEYEFEIKNTGTIASYYKIKLENTCIENKEYVIEGESVVADKCIDNKYIKVGIKEGEEEYKVLEYDEEDGYVIDAGELNKGDVKSYKMKIWLAYETPNDYASKDGKTVMYSGKLSLEFEQNKIYSIISDSWKDKTSNEKSYKAIFTLDSKELPEQKEFDNAMYTKQTEIDISDEQNGKVILGEYQDESGNLIAIIGANGKVSAPINSEEFFAYLDVTTLDLSHLDTSITTNMNAMFASCSNLQEIDLSSFDTSKVEQMNKMFAYDRALTKITFPKNFGSNAEDMSAMFASCKALPEVDLSNFDTSKARIMNKLFSYDEALTKITFPNNFGSNAEDMEAMFSSCSNLPELDLSTFDTSKVTTMRRMFAYDHSLANITFPKSFGNIVENIEDMFKECSALQELDLSGFNTRSVTNVTDLFKRTPLTKLTVGCNWTLTDYTTMYLDESVINKVCEE